LNIPLKIAIAKRRGADNQRLAFEISERLERSAAIERFERLERA